MSDAITALSIPELGARLRDGRLSPVALAELALTRLDGEGRELNAVVTLLRERAMRAAARAAAELAAGHDRGPLHGIPYGAKDLLAAADAPTTWGAAPYREQRIPHDAAVIERLETAGAVLVAKLSMVELAGGMGYEQPDASFTGPGRNPHNRDAWSGGSSSGSGSAVGAGLVPFAIGSETQGSITTPAALCGISGLRPTYGRVSRYGAMPLSWTMDKIGPMCRTAEDCGLVLAAIAGADPRDPTTEARGFRYPPTQPRATGFRLAVLSGSYDDVEPAVRANFEVSLARLSTVATVDTVMLPELPYGAVSSVVIGAEAASVFEELIASGGIAALTAPEDRVKPYALETISAQTYLRAMRIRRQIAQAVDAMCAPFDAVLSPTLPATAPMLNQPFANAIRRQNAPLTAAANLAGVPAITVPNGTGERGPTAIQFTGRAWSESRILAVAHAYQALINGETG